MLIYPIAILDSWYGNRKGGSDGVQGLRRLDWALTEIGVIAEHRECSAFDRVHTAVQTLDPLHRAVAPLLRVRTKTV